MQTIAKQISSIAKKIEELEFETKAMLRKKAENDIKDEIVEVLKQGHLSLKVRIFFDSKKEKHYIIQNNEITYIEKKVTLEILVFENFGIKVSYQRFGSMIPRRDCIFDPTMKLENITNLFTETILLECIRTASVEKFKRVDFSKYPNIYKLLKNLLVEGDSIDYFCRWLGNALKERDKNRTAIIIKGAEGTGKGVLQKFLIEFAYGASQVATISNEELKSRFQGILENKMFIIANEAKADFRDGSTTYERLKMLVTDPDINIEEKGLPTKQVRTYFNMLFFSNHDTPIQIQPSDRRYTVFQTANTRLDQICNTDELIEGIISERFDFLFEVGRLLDTKCANFALNSFAKKAIQKNSNNKKDLFVIAIKTKDIKEVENWIDDVENLSINERESIFNNPTPDLQKFRDDVISAIDDGLIKNSLLVILYKLAVNPTERSLNTIGYCLDFIGKKVRKRLGGRETQVEVFREIEI